MARIALYDVDSKIPNLALMKLARFHLECGDEVLRYDPALGVGAYDKVYASKVFGFTDGSKIDPERMVVGGTGLSVEGKLPPEVDALKPHYGLYPGFKGNLGFAMRGCRMRCSFCYVPSKEGHAKSESTIADLIVQDSDFLVLLDNDFFGNPEWRDRIGEIRERRLTVNLSQGINIRVITEEQAAALASIRFTNLARSRSQVYFAWDRPRDERLVLRGIQRLRDAGIKPWRMACFVLIGFDSTPEEDMHRVLKLRELGCDPYAMPIDKSDPYQKRFARWVNHRAIFNKVAFEDYDPGAKKGRGGRG